MTTDPIVVPPAPTDTGSSLRHRAFLVVVALQFALIIAMGAAGIALPAVQEGLDASDGEIQWFAALFQLGFALVLVLGGRLGDLFGTRRLLLIGFGLFVGATVLGAVAPNIAVVLLARLVQGIAGGIASPQLLAVIQRTFVGDTRTRAFAVFMTVAASAFMVGQLVSGALISSDVLGWGWRWAFLAFLPLGFVTWPLASRLLPPDPVRVGGRVDVVGSVVLAVASLLVLFPLIQGQSAGWPLWLLGLLVAALPALAAFVAVERRLVRRGAEPLVDPALFGLRSFRVGNVIGVVTGLLSFAVVVFVTLTIQYGFDRSALEAAALTAPIPFANMFGSLAAAPLLRTMGRTTIAVGAVLTAVAAVVVLVTLSFGSDVLEPFHLVPGLVLLGFALGISISATVAITLADVPEVSAGSASGVQSTVLQLASAVGIAVYGIVFFGVVGDVDTEASYLDGLGATMWLTAGLCVVQFVLYPLLPRHTAGRPHAIPVADPDNLIIPAFEPDAAGGHHGGR
ncbi:MFS transporter [Rhabdothermincola salaria]|uniref:MFS transporter n=1 Tax=Rhabdothermincola salaria TaxID=2903142 RepID=UPI001E518516|nr:MFS transporter [Rhabdothermincola salaria]